MLSHVRKPRGPTCLAIHSIRIVLRRMAEVHTIAKLPSVLAAETGTPAERRAGYVVLLDQEREQQHGHWR